MNNLFVKIGAVAGVLGLVLSVVALVGGNQPVADSNVGGLYQTNKTQFIEGFTAGKSNQFSVSNAGAVTSGAISATTGTFSGDVTIPTVQGATSTLIVGQVQTYATSAATVVCQKYLAVATTSANGFVTWSYGVCP